MPSYTILSEQLNLLMEYLMTRSEDLDPHEVMAIIGAISDIKRFISS